MPKRRKKIGITVFDAALDRMIEVYEAGHRVIVAFSGGKDSGICVEVCRIAAQMTNRLPVEVVMRDEEVMYPGTYEYAERLKDDPDIKFHWLIAGQPVVNICNRVNPYFWVFDDRLKPEEWVRTPPDDAQWIPELDIDHMVHPGRFPPPEGKTLMLVIGLRVQESAARRLGLFSSGGYITKEKPTKVRHVRPIYDWTDGDVWRAIQQQKWDYNRSYDVMHQLGIKRSQLRIGPPTLNRWAAKELQTAARAWPQWFDKVCERLQGVRQVVLFGDTALTPRRKFGESWEATFKRECIEKVPAQWIADRSTQAMEGYLRGHAQHSTMPLPEVHHCKSCSRTAGSWKRLALNLYNGDPFCLKTGHLKYIHPDFFREGAGRFEGAPSW